MHFGIDFGSKKAGTTVVCFAKERELHYRQSAKNEDADKLILDLADKLKPKAIYIDAPLSLPLAYYNPKLHKDFFYRGCDRQMKAMSPMFLGGLTARAMSLKQQLERQKIRVIEVYPKALALDHINKSDYEKQSKAALPGFMKKLSPYLPESFRINDPDNWHQADALLAWWSGHRHQRGLAIKIGNEAEGVIVY